MTKRKMTLAQKEAMKHSHKLGAGARKRKSLRGQAKVGVVMSEFKRGTLHSGGSGKIVKKRSQAIAIAMSEAKLNKKKGGKYGTRKKKVIRNKKK